METRIIIAYSMIAVMVVAAVIFYLRVTRERRLDRKDWRNEEKSRQRRRKDARAAAQRDHGG